MPVTERDLSHEVKTYNNKSNSKTTTTNSKTITTSNSSSTSSTSSSKSPKKKQKTSNNNSSIQTLIKIDSKQPFDLSTSAFTIAAERCILYNSTATINNQAHANNTPSIDQLVPLLHDEGSVHNSDPFESVHSSTGIVEPIRNSSSNNTCNDKASVEEGHNSDPAALAAYWSPTHSVDIDLTASDTI